MKRFIAVLLVAGLALMPTFAQAMWVNGGVVTNPTSNAVLVDTGALGGGSSTYTFIIASTVVARTEIVVRNAANTADVTKQTVPSSANSAISLTIPIDVPPGGRVIVRLVTGVTGVMDVSILKDGPA